VPQLPCVADPGSLTGWLLQATSTETSDSISRGLEAGFSRLVDNLPDANDANYDQVMQVMVDEIVNSDTLNTYLTATNFGTNKVRITTIHSIARYSAGFGGSNALLGRTLGLLGEMRGDQLPMLVRFGDGDPTGKLAHALEMEEVSVPPKALVDT
jgi:hypothetical protein